jgi:hypothetical protein
MAGASSVKQALVPAPNSNTLFISELGAISARNQAFVPGKDSQKVAHPLSRYQCIKATSISRLGRCTGRLAAGAGLKRVFPFYFTNVSTLQGFERILTIRNGEVLEL